MATEKRTPKRKRTQTKGVKLATGIWREQYNIRVIWYERGRPRQKGFDHDTPLKVLQAFQKRQQLNADGAAIDAGERGSFVRDVVRYLRTRKHRPSYKSDRSHLRPWAKRFGRFSRHAINAEKIMQALADWHDKSPRELRHRVNVLRQVFNLLDPNMANPCDRVKLPKIPKTRPRGVPDDIVQIVWLRLEQQERKGRLRDGKTRARFAVLATCAKRPCQVMRAKPEHLNFTTRTWDVLPAKNSHGGPLYLNDEMLAAWRLFVVENAWGEYDPVSFAKTLRRNGWPAGVRPYNLRHQTLQTMSNNGVDFGAVQQAAGHASPETTRRSYVPHELAQSKAASEAIDGRFDPRVFAAREIRVSARAMKAARKAARMAMAATGGNVAAFPHTPLGNVPKGHGEAAPATAAMVAAMIGCHDSAQAKMDKRENVKKFVDAPRLVKRRSGGGDPSKPA